MSFGTDGPDDMRLRRVFLATAFAALALAAAGLAALSAARLDSRLTEERILAQAASIAEDLAQLADVGAPIRDYTGFSSGAKSFLATERRLTAVEVRDRDGETVFSAARPGGAVECEPARCLSVDIASRIQMLGDLGSHGTVVVSVVPAAPFGLFDGAAMIALAAIFALAVIGVVHFLIIADDDALDGPRAARAWSLCALPPALVIGLWLTASSGDAYLERARVTADALADRLRAAVDIQVDPVGFSGLEELFRAASAANDGLGPTTRLRLSEGRRAVVDVADGSAAEEAGEGLAGLDLSVSRSVRPRTLAYPSLSIVAVVPWSGVVRSAPTDHAIALTGLAAYALGPAVLFLLVGRRRRGDLAVGSSVPA